MAISIEQLNANRAKIGLPPLPDTVQQPQAQQATQQPVQPQIDLTNIIKKVKSRVPEVQKKTGILEDVGKRRGTEVVKSIKAQQRGEQGLTSTIGQIGGQVLGGASDVLFGATKKIASAITPNFIEKPIVEAGTKALSALMGTKPGQFVTEKLQKLEQTDTKGSRNIKALLGASELALDVTGIGFGAKTGEKVAVRAAEQIGKKVAEREVKTLPKKISKAENKSLELYKKAANVAPSSKKKYEQKFGEDFAVFLRDNQVPLTADGTLMKTKPAKAYVKKQLIEPAENNLTNLLKTKTEKFSLSDLLRKYGENLNKQNKLVDVAEKEAESAMNFIKKEAQKYGDQMSASEYNELKRRFNKFFDKADSAKNNAARDLQSIIRRDIEQAFDGDPIIRNLNREYSKYLEALKTLEKMNDKTVRGGILGKKLAQITGAIALNKIPFIGEILGYQLAGKITDYMLDPKRLTEKAIKELHDLNVVPKSLKVKDDVLDYLSKDLLKKLRGEGKRLELPEAKPGTPRGIIPMPEMTETARQKSVSLSGLLKREPTILPQEPRTGQLQIPERATPPPIIPPAPTTFEKPAKIIGNQGVETLQTKNFEQLLRSKGLKEAADIENEITKRVDKFRKEADLMASNEGAGVRQRKVDDAVGDMIFMASDFKLSRAKADMRRRANDTKSYAKEILYEEDETFRRLVDKRDELLAKSDFETMVKKQEDVFDAIFEEIGKDINNIEKYEQKKTTTLKSVTSKNAQSKVPEKLKPLTKTTSKDLLEEARKYDSADEFVKAQVQKDFQERVIASQDLGIKKINPDGTITLYHATPKGNAKLIENNGFNENSYFALSKTDKNATTLSEFVKQDKFKNGVDLMEIKIDPRGLSWEGRGGTELISNEKLFKDTDGIYKLKENLYETRTNLVSGDRTMRGGESSPNVNGGNRQNESIKPNNGTHTDIIRGGNKENVKTKSQLKEIWEQANKKQLPNKLKGLKKKY